MFDPKELNFDDAEPRSDIPGTRSWTLLQMTPEVTYRDQIKNLRGELQFDEHTKQPLYSEFSRPGAMLCDESKPNALKNGRPLMWRTKQDCRQDLKLLRAGELPQLAFTVDGCQPVPWQQAPQIQAPPAPGYEAPSKEKQRKAAPAPGYEAPSKEKQRKAAG